MIDMRGASPEVKRELKILRRPTSTCIKDDGSLLAVLSSEMQVDVYDMQQSPPRLRQSLILDNAPRTIAMSPGGSVLAAAYEGGIEVSSLNPTALATERRSVKCDAVDGLAFSYDGTQILGTTFRSQSPSTVILTAPYYDPGTQMMAEDEGAMWTTSILFPNTSRDCSHAVLLQDGSNEEAAWTFTYDRSFETFRAVRIDDLRNGTTYFTGPVPDEDTPGKLLPSTLPAATYRGDLVSAGFHGKEIWIYGVPEDLDAVPETAPPTTGNSSPASGLRRRESNNSNLSRNPSNRTNDLSNGRVPQWQLLNDKNRNTFVAGAKVSEISDAKNVKWVAGFGGDLSLRERLVTTAPGVSESAKLVTDEEDMDFVDGGRVALLDFDYSLHDGRTKEVTIELGSERAEPLEEAQRDMETEVAIVRRRTVAKNRGSRTTLLRAATTLARNPEVPPVPRSGDHDDDPLLPRRTGQLAPSSSTPAVPAEEGDVASIEEQEALDAPYAHASPRSGTTLRRAATAAAVNRNRNPTTADGRPIEYRRADGRREHPHESDADNWVPPPPPYQKDDPGATPAFLRGPPVAPLPSPKPPASHDPSALPIPRDAVAPSASAADMNRLKPVVPQSGSVTPEWPVRQAVQEGRTDSSVQRPNGDNEDDEDLYDVSPPDSPRPHSLQPVESSISRQEPSAEDQTAPTPLNSRPQTAQTTPSMLSHTAEPIPHALPIMNTPPRQSVPTLNLDIPFSSPWAAQPSGSLSSPGDRRMPNAQTWPVGPHGTASDSAVLIGGFPVSAPVPGTVTNDFEVPPVPASGQIESLNRRISQGNPRRLSGAMQLQRVPVGSRSGERQAGRIQPSHTFGSTNGQPRVWEEPDQPLIISTPRGVTGAFDSLPEQPAYTQTQNNDPPLIAPVPRHPRPTAGSRVRPTVERLETIYSIAPDPQAPATAPATRGPRWLYPKSTGAPERSASQQSRRSMTRAERSAAKNMEAARKKAFEAKMKKNESSRKKKKQKAESEMASTAWTDMSTRSAPAKSSKDKKCVVM